MFPLNSLRYSATFSGHILNSFKNYTYSLLLPYLDLYSLSIIMFALFLSQSIANARIIDILYGLVSSFLNK